MPASRAGVLATATPDAMRDVRPGAESDLHPIDIVSQPLYAGWSIGAVVDGKQLMQANRKTKVLVVDGHPVVISGCRAIFANDRSVQIISATNEREGFEAYRQSRPHVAIIDIKLPDLSGYELLRKIRKEDPEAKVIIFSVNDDPAFVIRAVELGAKGFVGKGDDPRHLVDAVREVARGTTFVSPQLAQSVTFASAGARAHPASQLNNRELEILRLLARGKKIAQVAEALDLSYKTIANTTTLLKQKLGAQNHADLVRIAVEFDI